MFFGAGADTDDKLLQSLMLANEQIDQMDQNRKQDELVMILNKLEEEMLYNKSTHLEEHSQAKQNRELTLSQLTEEDRKFVEQVD